MAKTFRLGAKLHYPITIRRIHKFPGDTVARQDTILEYSFDWEKVTGDDTRGIAERIKQTTTVTWVSPSDGKIKDLYLIAGQVVRSDANCVLIEETCGHEIQVHGMCAVCGKDMTEVTWASEERDTDRAPINMTHDSTHLTVSQAAAQKLATEQQTRLLEQRKLSLVVDLDQTIIHACIEPTVGEWQRDPTNPNYDAVKDVRSFQLNDEGPRGLATGCWYYIKLRPGLQEFLEKISEMYQLHVYTMGTRAYAQNIAKLVDPDQKLFGNRVISRDESGSLTAKSLERLFPTSTGMVAIIDDRADVWPKDRDNLVKVVPYDFFKGIGDINSSFLPKRQDIAPAPTPMVTDGNGSSSAAESKQEGASGTNNGDSQAPSGSGDVERKPPSPVSALEEFVTMNGGDDSVLRQRQAEEQEHLLEKQLTERPLLHLQEQLDKEDESANSNSTQTPAITTTPPPADENSGDDIPDSQASNSSNPQRHNLLRDDDRELYYLTDHLTHLHRAFYDDYGHKQASGLDPSLIPDVGRVLSDLKRKVLHHCTIVLSGLVPLDIDVHKSELGLQVKSFGASIHTRVTPMTTHLVISTARPRTHKVRQAARIPSIKIVNQNWLLDSMSQWKMLDIEPYSVEVQEGFKPDDEGDSHYTEDEAEDLETYMPQDLQDGESSPIDDMKTFDWGEADQELEDFLASGTEDDDDDEEGDTDFNDNETEDYDNDPDVDGGETSVSNGTSTPRKLPAGTKRKLGVGDTEDDDGDESDSSPESALAKRQKFSAAAVGSASRSRAAGVGKRQLLTPLGTGDDEDIGIEGGAGASGSERADSSKYRPNGIDITVSMAAEDDDLEEADLLAMLEAEDSEKG